MVWRTRSSTQRHSGPWLNAGEFLEWAEVHGHLYGTSEARVKAALDRGEDIVLKIDVQGAAWIRPRVAGAIFIFLLPPSEGELRRRLVKPRH